MNFHFDYLVGIVRSLERELEKILDMIHHHHPHKYVRRSRFNFSSHNFKFSSIMDSKLTVPSGTPVDGFNNPIDVKGNDLPDSFYKPGSCVYGVKSVDGDTNPPGFSLAPGATEEDFSVTETVPGAASQGVISFDAQDVDGNQLPTSFGTLIFTATPPKAVGSRFSFNQTSH